MFEELSRRPGSFGEGVQVTQSLWLCSRTLSDGSVPPFLESTYLFLQVTESFFNLQNISVNSYLGAKDTKKRNLTPPRFFFGFSFKTNKNKNNYERADHGPQARTALATPVWQSPIFTWEAVTHLLKQNNPFHNLGDKAMTTI